MISTLPYMLILLFMPLWKPDEVSMLSMIFTVIPVSICALVIWTMRRAYKTVRSIKTLATWQAPDLEPATQNTGAEPPHAVKKPVWPWLVIVPGALLLLSMGPGAMMLPIMPLYLAAMSTDSGTAPSYVPALLVIIGYALICGYVVLLVRAIKALRAK
ncbi:hypothetical protein [Planomicrobium sp. CPCC 101079]|uniref:hypothetical protein n=1 Tax=Planomicrobium sp. CPCC 101079 TaxID=2599618 RepID=UPI0011B644A2|nr:hypothetical protein [Planomicrobium sp. CPCC 101079]TWT14576.1 hypothetical protein FQV28_01125 [Planomicrobium sp. CPCC 101079]